MTEPEYRVFVAVCYDCDLKIPQRFRTAAERDVWIRVHKKNNMKHRVWLSTSGRRP